MKCFRGASEWVPTNEYEMSNLAMNWLTSRIDLHRTFDVRQGRVAFWTHAPSVACRVYFCNRSSVAGTKSARWSSGRSWKLKTKCKSNSFWILLENILLENSYNIAGYCRILQNIAKDSRIASDNISFLISTNRNEFRIQTVRKAAVTKLAQVLRQPGQKWLCKRLPGRWCPWPNITGYSKQKTLHVYTIIINYHTIVTRPIWDGDWTNAKLFDQWFIDLSLPGI